MSRPDAPAFTRPALLTETPIIGVSTDTAPALDEEGSELAVGALWLHEDTGGRYYWTGSAWSAVTAEQADALRLDLLFEIRDMLRSQTDEEEE